MLSIFFCVYWASGMSSLKKWLFRSSIHSLTELLVLLIWSCMSYLYMLEINHFSVASFAIISSHSKACLFILFIVSCSGQKLLRLIRSHLFIFVFIFITLGSMSKRKFLRLCQRILYLCFSLRVLCFAALHLGLNVFWVYFCVGCY